MQVMAPAAWFCENQKRANKVVRWYWRFGRFQMVRSLAPALWPWLAGFLHQLRSCKWAAPIHSGGAEGGSIDLGSRSPWLSSEARRTRNA